MKENYTTRKQGLLFLFAGGLNTLFGYGIFAFFISLGINYLFASFISIFLGVIFNFITIGKFVFNKLNFKYIRKFILFYIILYVLYVFFIKLFILCQFNIYLCGMIAGGFVAILSFITSKYLIFYE